MSTLSCDSWCARGSDSLPQRAMTTDVATASVVRFATSKLVEGFPAELEAVLVKALEKDAENRSSSAEEMRVALEHAVPEAFGDAGHSGLKAFVDQLIGDRRAPRREAVRRAQLAADAHDAETRANSWHTSAQSASSLPAISISRPVPRNAPELLGADTMVELKPVSPEAKRISKVPYIAAVVGLVLVVTVTVPALVAPEHAATPAATGGVEAGTPMPSSATSATNPRGVAAAPPLDPEPSVLTQVPSLAAFVASAASAQDELKPKPLPPRAPANSRPTTAARSPTQWTNHDELMSPDYAR